MLHLLHAKPENLNSERSDRRSSVLKTAVKLLAPASLGLKPDERRVTYVSKYQRVNGEELVTLAPIGGPPAAIGANVSVDLDHAGRQLTAKGVVERWSDGSVTVRLRRPMHDRPPRSRRVRPAPYTVVVSFVAQGAGLGRSFQPVIDLDERGLRMQSRLPFLPGTELTQLRLLQHPHVLREGEGIITRTHKVIAPNGDISYECGVRLKPPARLAPVDDPADLQRVTHPERVRTILWGLSDLGYPVTLKAGTRVYSATLQHVKGPRHDLPTLLCRLDSAAAISGAVSLECTLYGSGYRCFCRVSGTEGTLLKLEPAPVVFEWHRRDEERFAIPAGLEGTLTFTHPMGGTRVRKLLDVSVTGCSAERFDDEQLWPGLPVRNVRLKLNGITHSMPDAEVRSAGDQKLGLSFGTMSDEAADAFRVSLAKLAVAPIELHDGEGVEPLLALYDQVGLFEGPMAEDLAPNKERAKEEWKLAHQHPKGLIRTAMLRWKGGVGGSSTLVRAYDKAWEFEHSAVVSPSVPVSPGLLFGTLVSLAVARPDGDYICTYVAETAKSLNKNHAGVLSRVVDARVPRLDRLHALVGAGAPAQGRALGAGEEARPRQRHPGRERRQTLDGPGVRRGARADAGADHAPRQPGPVRQDRAAARPRGVGQLHHRLRAEQRDAAQLGLARPLLELAAQRRRAAPGAQRPRRAGVAGRRARQRAVALHPAAAADARPGQRRRRRARSGRPHQGRRLHPLRDAALLAARVPALSRLALRLPPRPLSLPPDRGRMTRAGSYQNVGQSVAEAEAARLAQQLQGLWAVERDGLKQAGLVNGAARLLEVGCGNGSALSQVAKEFTPGAAFGVELQWEHARRAKAVAPVSRADGARLPFRDGAFEVVFFRYVLRHVVSPGALLKEAHRVLAPGGRLIALDADDGSLMLDPVPEGWAKLSAGLEQSARRRGANPFMGRTLHRELVDAGFEEVQAYAVAISSSQLSAPSCVELILAPQARPLDADLLDPESAAAAWAQLRAWAQSPRAFFSAAGVAAGGRKR
ncbi:MAG: methyltransferase domain-containing protein [Myxococcaceae bacterium]